MRRATSRTSSPISRPPARRATPTPSGTAPAEIHLLLARCYFHSAQLGRAEAAAREVIAEAPDDAYAHLLLGRTLQRAGRADEARGPLRLAELLGGYGTAAGPAAKVADEGF
ncbi:tetratricopeptide repeat protein [Janibacter sp. YB324]|uniref:tetratricopeptide repeat protein n=1 Tax=Janibacter sp. YB324 TaxID=2761047 RepID=UPI001CB8DA65|nr:tetratricopeptide repeat protein [Janibacter sp. YB324]